MDNIVYGVQLHPCGQICYFSSGAWPGLSVSSHVVLQVDKGEALAQIVKIISKAPFANNDTSPEDASLPINYAEHKDAPEDSPASVSANENPVSLARPNLFAGEAFEPDEWEDSGSLLSDLKEGPTGDTAEGDTTSLCLDPSSEYIQPILRPANSVDQERAARNSELAHDARFFCMQRAKFHQLDMKVVMADYFLDRSKIIFYFTAPSRIDFRELVKDLVKEYRTRIELRQIGSRHETQMIGGVGNCGMTCCCRRYMRSFDPVTIKMAKEQNLFLNPTKISGTCGRLLCCLAFEQEGYEEFHSRCPKMGKKYETSKGIFKVLRSSIFRNSISVLPEVGEELEVTLEEWQGMSPNRYGHLPQPPKNADASSGEQQMPKSTDAKPAEQPKKEKRTNIEPLTSDSAPSIPIEDVAKQMPEPLQDTAQNQMQRPNQERVQEPAPVQPTETTEFKQAGLSRFLAATSTEEDD